MSLEIQSLAMTEEVLRGIGKSLLAKLSPKSAVDKGKLMQKWD